MALSVFLTAAEQSTDATFRVWGKAISDALTSVGVAKSADTGQIDWATVTTPTVYNTSMGYEIRVFADTLQATVPVVIKIEYGCGQITSPGLWITVGTATNGAGVLTSIITTRRQLSCVNISGSTAYVNRVTGATNRVALWAWVNRSDTNYQVYFSVERIHNAAGADTNEGFTLLSGMYNDVQLVTFLFGSGVVSTETLLPALMPSVGTGASGSIVTFYPIFPTKGVFMNPLANVLIAFQANVSPGTQVSFPYYGATKAFMPLNNTTVSSKVRGSVAGSCYLVRDE